MGGFYRPAVMPEGYQDPGLAKKRLMPSLGGEDPSGMPNGIIENARRQAMMMNQPKVSDPSSFSAPESMPDMSGMNRLSSEPRMSAPSSFSAPPMDNSIPPPGINRLSAPSNQMPPPNPMMSQPPPISNQMQQGQKSITQRPFRRPMMRSSLGGIRNPNRFGAGGSY